MRILFLARREWPEVGGVETHIKQVGESLRRKGHKVTIITEKDIGYPKVKFLGLFYIWFWFLRNLDLIKQSDLVHCHDVFVWYLPFRFLFPKKPVYTTFHGWGGRYPIPIKEVFLTRLAWKLSTRTIAIGKYIEKYYGIKANRILYGGVAKKKKRTRKIKNSIVFVGRLEEDTGARQFLGWLEAYQRRFKVDFVGDGPLLRECKKYGKVHGFTDPTTFYKKAEVCVPGGYLSYLEAKSYGCKILAFANNPLKEDYWKEIARVKKFPSWEEVVDEYLRLYHRS